MPKICNRCLVQKELSAFSPNKECRDGRGGVCKACHAENKRLHYAADPVAARERLRTYRAQNPEKRKTWDKTQREKHREKRVQHSRAYRMKHHERLLAQVRKRSKERFAENPVLVRAKRRHYKKTHPDMVRASNTRRRAVKKNAPKVERITHSEIAERDRWMCHICFKKVTKKTWSLDHLNPLSKGGTHTKDNVALAHRLCNSRRGAGLIPAQLLLLG